MTVLGWICAIVALLLLLGLLRVALARSRRRPQVLRLNAEARLRLITSETLHQMKAEARRNGHGRRRH